MLHRNRALLALGATLGTVLALFAIPAPASAGDYVPSVLPQPAAAAPQDGTLDNGVGWNVDIGSPSPEQGYILGNGQTQTWTFDEPVLVEFTLAGLNCGGEGVRVPEDATPVDIHPQHSWNPATHVITTAGAAGGSQSTFALTAPVTSYSLTGVGAPGCGRGIVTQTVSAFRNATPEVSIAAPVDGGVFTQGQTVPADFSCSDADTTHVDEVDCVGEVANGSPIDTSSTGAHSFTVTATDEHGAVSQETVSYTVVDQAGVCSGVAVGLPLNLNLGAANAGGTPCVTDSAKVADLTVSLGTLPFPLTALSPKLTVKVAEGSSVKDGNTHRGAATVANVKIEVPLNGWSLELKDLWSEVSASTPVSCAAGSDLQGEVEIGRIIRNGTTVYNRLNQPLSIPIPLLGGVYLNQVTTSGNRVEANAVAVDLPGGLLDINIGSSVAGVDC